MSFTGKGLHAGVIPGLNLKVSAKTKTQAQANTRESLTAKKKSTQAVTADTKD